MAQRPPTSEFADVPLDDARRISRSSRTDPERYDVLKQNIQALDTTACSSGLPPTKISHRPMNSRNARTPASTQARSIPSAGNVPNLPHEGSAQGDLRR